MSDFKLDNYPKIKSGFKVPEGYFDSVSEKVTARIQQPEAKVISMRSKRNWFVAAAALLLLALSIPMLQENSVTNQNLDDASIENYLSYQSNFSQYDIVNLLNNEDLEKVEADLPIENTAIEDLLISNANFENYIID